LHTASERPLVQPEKDLSGDLGWQDQIQVSIITLLIPTIPALESTPIVAGTGIRGSIRNLKHIFPIPLHICCFKKYYKRYIIYHIILLMLIYIGVFEIYFIGIYS